MMRKSLLALAVLISVQFAQAEDDLMKILEGQGPAKAAFVENDEIQKLKQAVNPSTAEQNIFFQFLVDKNYEKALFQWRRAFSGHTFSSTATGQALQSYLYFKNGLRLTGVESLLAIKEPAAINASVVGLWKESLQGSDSIFELVQANWSPYWTTVFGSQAEMTVLLQKSYVNEELAVLTDLIKQTAPDSKERALLSWQLALNLGIRGEAGKAAQVLAHLMKAKNNPIDSDLMTLTAGRLLYQNGFLDASIKYYEKIGKKSDYWFTAQEELAWAYMRKGEPQNALSVTKTLTYPHFKGWVGIESYLLGAFSSLKVCDYPEVIKVMGSVKGQFGDHLVALEKISKDPQQKAVQSLMDKMEKGVISAATLKQEAHLVPAQAMRDEVLMQLVKKKNALQQEAKESERLYAQSLTFGDLQGEFESMKTQANSRARLSEGASYQRVQELAKLELEDSKQVLQRLRIVEVEMIQQVDSSGKFLKAATKAENKMGTTGSTSAYAMKFTDAKDVWFDELSNYKVNVKKGCAQNTVKE